MSSCSVFVMAHEIGHNLGMYHDDSVSTSLSPVPVTDLILSGGLHQGRVHHVSVPRYEGRVPLVSLQC